MPSTAEGVFQQCLVKEQSTMDAMLAFVAGDGVSPVRGTFKIEPECVFEPTKEAVGSPSLQGEIITRKGGKWSGQFYVKPNAAGTAPDIGPLIKAAMGAEAVVGGASVTYSLDGDSHIPLQAVLHVPGRMQQVASGMWVEEMTIDVAGRGIPTISFSGGFATYGWVNADIIGTGGVATAASSCPLADASRGCVGVNGRVQIGDDTNGGAGYLVTSVTQTGGAAAFGFSPVLAGAGELAGEEVWPLIPTPTLAGTILGASECGLTVDGAALGFVSAKINYKFGRRGLDKEATTYKANRIGGGLREVTAEIQCYWLESNTGNANLIGRGWDGTTRDLYLRIGADTAAARMKINLDKVRLNVVPIEIPDAEEAMVTLSAVARQNSASDDESNIVFD
jgi:hypothetical protein